MPTLPKEIALYVKGELVALGTAEQMAFDLGIDTARLRRSIITETPFYCAGKLYTAKYTGRKVSSPAVESTKGRKRKYFPVFAPEPKRVKSIPLVDLDAICKAEGKEYGQLQAEIAAGRKITKEEIAAAKAEMKKRKAERLRRITERKGKK